MYCLFVRRIFSFPIALSTSPFDCEDIHSPGNMHHYCLLTNMALLGTLLTLETRPISSPHALRKRNKARGKAWIATAVWAMWKCGVLLLLLLGVNKGPDIGHRAFETRGTASNAFKGRGATLFPTHPRHLPRRYCCCYCCCFPGAPRPYGHPCYCWRRRLPHLDLPCF